MRKLLLLTAFGTALAIGAVYPGAAIAQDKQKLLQDRQDLMQNQGRQWLAIRNYVQGKADQSAALAAVAALEKSLPTVPDYFPPGSEGANPDGKWGPKPEVWSEHDKFLAANRQVADQVAAVGAGIRSGDKSKVEAAFKELDICSACHKTFRAKLQ
jgi:cytochrome c556